MLVFILYSHPYLKVVFDIIKPVSVELSINLSNILNKLNDSSGEIFKKTGPLKNLDFSIYLLNGNNKFFYILSIMQITKPGVFGEEIFIVT